VSTLEAIILGIIQGITEFFPVSSSGHLALSQAILGFDNFKTFILFDLICHLGTLLAIVFVFRTDIISLFIDKTRLKQLMIATLPLFPLVFLLHPLKAMFDQIQYLGFFFMATALLLFLGMRYGYQKEEDKLQKSRWRDPLILGLFQAIALFPGVSRSGSTISGARLLGWNIQEAISFSFLMAIPAILGAVSLEVIQIALGQTAISPSLSFVQYAVGFLSSAVVGGVTLIFLKRLAEKPSFMYFVWYCLALGIFSLLYFST
jgi:undecaprenyl-diphosphatase